jgi:hypothetical protein
MESLNMAVSSGKVATKQMVLSAISGYILDEALLAGKFGR